MTLTVLTYDLVGVGARPAIVGSAPGVSSSESTLGLPSKAWSTGLLEGTVRVEYEVKEMVFVLLLRLLVGMLLIDIGFLGVSKCETEAGMWKRAGEPLMTTFGAAVDFEGLTVKRRGEEDSC